jgi:hypothetical protein
MGAVAEKKVQNGEDYILFETGWEASMLPEPTSPAKAQTWRKLDRMAQRVACAGGSAVVPRIRANQRPDKILNTISELEFYSIGGMCNMPHLE